MATWALALPRRVIREVPVAEEGGGPGGGDGGAAEVAAQVAVALASPGRVRGPDWRAEGHSPAQEARCGPVREPAHVHAGGATRGRTCE